MLLADQLRAYFLSLWYNPVESSKTVVALLLRDQQDLDVIRGSDIKMWGGMTHDQQNNDPSNDKMKMGILRPCFSTRTWQEICCLA